MKLRRLRKVIPRDNYSLELFFEDGEHKIFSLLPLLTTAPFADLRDPVAFRHVHIDDVAGTAQWLSGQDISPTVLYEESITI